MLTDAFYTVLTSALRSSGASGGFTIAVGSGLPAWDERRPAPERGVTQLVAELARVAVAAEDIVFLDGERAPSPAPTPRLQFSATFAGDEAVGTLRECGLFTGGAAGAAPTLLSYFTHPRIAKADGMVLARTVRLDLTPRAVTSAPVATRFLGNVRQRELHDLDNLTARCQVDEIRFDRRFFFATVEEAVAAGYDFCAYCFGRELSQR